MRRVAIVGGGPGGLISALMLGRKCPGRCEIALFECDTRLGGKLQTRTFAAAPVPYEAGVAECYSYRRAGGDPLRGLIEELGLETRATVGGAVVLEGRILHGEEDLERHWGRATADAVRRFREQAAAASPPIAAVCGGDLLDAVADPIARRYLQVALHSDLATEPSLTSARTVLDKTLLDVPGEVECYTILGGMGRLAERLAERIGDTRIELGARVTRVGQSRDGYTIGYRRRGAEQEERFDAVILALPVGRLGGIVWEGERLHRAMAAHLAPHEQRGHYLRVSLLFDRPFWTGALQGSWFMVDDFGGACVYLESERFAVGGHGVLGFLLAGSDALAMANLDDAALADRVLESVPGPLADGARRHLLEARVHRWCGLLSAVSGGDRRRAPEDVVRPDPDGHPEVFAVGDYLFESTLNGVYRSADLATDRLAGAWPGRVADTRLMPLAS